MDTAVVQPGSPNDARMSDETKQSAKETGSDEDLRRRMQQLTTENQRHPFFHHELGQNTRGETGE